MYDEKKLIKTVHGVEYTVYHNPCNWPEAWRIEEENFLEERFKGTSLEECEAYLNMLESKKPLDFTEGGIESRIPILAGRPIYLAKQNVTPVKKPCHVCNGSGKIKAYKADGDEMTINCINCNGVNSMEYEYDYDISEWHVVRYLLAHVSFHGAQVLSVTFESHDGPPLCLYDDEIKNMQPEGGCQLSYDKGEAEKEVQLKKAEEARKSKKE